MVGLNACHVVRSSYGCLRIALDNWCDTAAEELIARLQAARGVTSAAATSITQNLLVLHDPRQIDSASLLAEIDDAWRRIRERSALDVQPLTLFPPRPATRPDDFDLLVAEQDGSDLEATSGHPTYVTGWRRTLYHIFGWASVGMAVVGAIMPGIPTAPFVILAGYFFIRSSPAAHQWLRQSRWFGPMLRDWEEHHGIRRSVRNLAVGLIVFSMVFVALLGLSWPLTLVIWATQIIGLAFVLHLRVVDQPSASPVLIAP
jgi:uncharacterized membrane protein YbaN (DUF454 family)